MVKLTTYEVKLIPKNRGIKNCQSMSRESYEVLLINPNVLPKIYKKMDLIKL